MRSSLVLSSARALISLTLCHAAWGQYGIISTIAGATDGLLPASSSAATGIPLGRVFGAAVDAQGNFYGADFDKGIVFRVTPAGAFQIVAGNQSQSYYGDGGPATAAAFDGPIGVAVDPSGNIFISDYANCRIRKVSPDGTITTYAGNGQASFSGDGGPASAAALNRPEGLTLDKSGNLYIADSDNARIRKVAPNGTITTVAGNGTVGRTGDGGPATAATLSFPTGVAVDSAGNLFIADSSAFVVRKVSATGTISTLPGAGLISTPAGVAVDAAGNVFVADSYVSDIVKISSAGASSVYAGNRTHGFSGDGGPATAATFYYSSAVALDASGNLFVADTYNGRVRKIAPNGTISTIAGNGQANFSGDGGPATSAHLSALGVAVDSNGSVFVADQYNNRIRRISGGTISTFAGSGIAGFPTDWTGLANFSGDGGPATSALLKQPVAVSVDGAGNVFVADTGNDRVRKISPNGVITTVAGNGSAGSAGDGGQGTAAQLNYPSGVAVDTSGNLYIADANNNRIRKVTPAGIISTVAGKGTAGFSGDSGPATAAQLNFPYAVAIDNAGNLYIVDRFNVRIRKVSAAGIITTIAGTGTAYFSGDGGPATSATLYDPYGVAVDAAGNVLIADTANGRVRSVSPGGTITTIAGTGYFGFSGDGGPATYAGLWGPEGVAADNSGNIYVADTGNARVRKVVQTSAPPQNPYIYSANNSADYSTTIAQGSLFVVFGSDLGPAVLTQVSSFPLPTVLAGTSVSVTSGGTTLSCPMIYTSAGQVAAILPSNTPTGQATITSSYEGYSVSYSAATINVVQSAVGIYTTTSNGLGVGIATAPDGSLKTYGNVAKQGEIVTIWATGLGGIPSPDNVLPSSFPSFPNVQVWAGGQAAQVVYAGRSGCCSAVDQIAFAVPAGVSGCNVPVVVVSGGVSSNTVSIPMGSVAGACVDSGPSIPTTVLSKAAAGQSVRFAAIGIGPASLGTQSPLAIRKQLASQLSAALKTKVTENDVAHLINAYSARDSGAIRKAMARFGTRWKALDSRTKAHIEAQLGQTREGVSAVFETVSNEAAATAMATAQFPVPGSCVQFPSILPSAFGHLGTPLDAGSSLLLTGAASAYVLTHSPGSYHVLLGSAIQGPQVPVGSYTISGAGGADVGPFSATLPVPGHFLISNKTSLTAIDRSQPLTINWTGGLSGKYVLIEGNSPNYYSADGRVPNTNFVCAADSALGSFTVPPYILLGMNPSGPGKGTVLVVPHPLSNPISVPGVDMAYFLDGSSDSVNVTFK